ncbi:uncharacterized protein V1510DRAFT_416888 [Dipodascopsis tothii]|uniref:uncharacterized protein n=1 Tax=Dipodascopsis tothii TaxID=44089 RepID=UPI0034CE2639
MAIAPITGMFKRRAIVDVSTAVVLGLATGSAYWHLYVTPKIDHRKEYLAKVKEERKQR